MTDAEIIKALEKLLKIGDSPIGEYFGVTIDKQTIKETLDLINRQKAEVDKLQKENNLFADLGKMYSEIKAEAIKEFAQRLKYRLTEYPECYFSERVTSEDIDNLVKEITGELGF